jgi:hypothetical protein
VTAPDGTSALTSTVGTVAPPSSESPPDHSLGHLLDIISNAEVTIGGTTYVLPTNPRANLDPIDTARSYAGSAETLARDTFRTIVVAGQTLQAKFVETWQAGANKVQWVIDETKGPLAVIGDQIVQLGANATQAMVQAFVDQLNAWKGNITDLWDRLQALTKFGDDIILDPDNNQRIDLPALLQQVVSNPDKIANNLLQGALTVVSHNGWPNLSPNAW